MQIEIVPFIAPMIDYENITVNRKNFDNRIALIDADRYKHLVAYRIYQKLNEGYKHDIQLVEEVIDDYLTRDIFNMFSAKAYIFCFSAPSSNVFRNYLAQEKGYKANRKEREDPHYYEQKFSDMAHVYEYVNRRYPTLIFDDLEADDIVSFLQNDRTFIYSHDKDLKQVPGWHFDIDKYNLIEISKDEAYRSFIKQMYTGDSTDNIPGIPGVGPKTVAKIFEDNNDIHSLILTCFNDYIQKFGFVEGISTFVEMYSLIAMKIDRGEYFREKYKLAFSLRDSLLC